MDPAQNGKTASRTCPHPIVQRRHLLGEEEWHTRAIMTYLFHMEKLKPREKRTNPPKAGDRTSDHGRTLVRSPEVQPVELPRIISGCEKQQLPSPRSRLGSRTQTPRYFSHTQCFYYMCPLSKTGRLSFPGTYKRAMTKHKDTNGSREVSQNFDSPLPTSGLPRTVFLGLCCA